MEYKLYKDGIEPSAEDLRRLERKLQGLRKHLQPPWQVDVRVRRNSHHRQGGVVTCSVEVQTILDKKPVYAEREENTLESACDAAIEAVEMKLRRSHDKNKERRK